MTQVARRGRAVLTSLGLLAALATSSASIAQPPQGAGSQDNSATPRVAGGECGDDTEYNKLYGVQGMMMTQAQANATPSDRVIRCAGCGGHPDMEECWLKPGTQDDATGGASDSGPQNFSSPYGTFGATPASGAPSTGLNPTPPTQTGQPPAQTGAPVAPTPAQPPLQWNGQRPTCTGGGWDKATCTFTDNRGQKWTGPQGIQCDVVNINLQGTVPFRAQYQVDPNGFQVTGKPPQEVVQVTFTRTAVNGNPPLPPDSIKVPFYKGTTGPTNPQIYCPRDVYTQPYNPDKY